jgi:hypothetical protein
VASPRRDTCHADLAFLACDRTNMEVTRVTTHRVTRGRLTSSDDVAADAAGRLGRTTERQVAVRRLTWHTRGPIIG